MKALRLPLFLLALAAACALLRWIDTYRIISSESVRFAHLHDVTWDDLGKRMARAGGDPYFVFDLPADAAPIRTITFHFIGHYVETEGTFYLFQSSGPVVAATVKQAPASFEISGRLERSTTLRLDLPDFLPRSIQLDRIVIRKPFVDWASWPFRLAVIALGGTLFTLAFTLRCRRPANA